MAFDLSGITEELDRRGNCVVFHGLGSSGKTTTLAQACLDKEGVMVLCEEGLSTLGIEGVKHTGGAVKDWDEFIDILTALATKSHPYKLVAVDALDKLISSLEMKVIREDFGGSEAKANSFMAKYSPMLAQFNRVIKAFSVLQSKGIDVMVSVHSVITQTKRPDSEPFATYDLALGGGAKTSMSAAIYDYCDACIYLGFKSMVSDGKIIGDSVRYAYTGGRETCTAKTRYKLPSEFAFSYTNFKQLMEEL